jgi:predicted transposase/invertase (TIGR01784 family)
MIEVIPLKYGVTFKRVFSDPLIFSQFASDVLDRPLHVEQVYTEYEYPETVGYVKIKYDLFAEDTEQRTIIEVQHIREDDFFDRFLYYHLIGLAEQVRSYYSYRFERTVYTIVVLTRLPQDQQLQFSYAVSDMSPVNEHNRQLAIYPHRLIFLGPRSVNAQTPPKVRPWLELIADSLDSQVEEANYDSAILRQMIERMRRQTLSPEELSIIKDEAAWEEAKQNALREGRAEGLAEGLMEGLVEGSRQKSLEIARAMLADGMEVAVVARLTGLTPAELEGT